MSDNPVLTVLTQLLDGQGKLTQLEENQTKRRVNLMERMDRLDNRQTAFRTEVMPGFETVEDRLTLGGRTSA